jgi:hypothetical protein
MVHHLTPRLDLSFLDHCGNVLLIRDPREVIASLVNQLPEPTTRDIGLQRQVELFRDLRERGQEPPVIDARRLLLDPAHVLQELCHRLGIGWDPAMLSWPPGPRREDGPWARYWYENVQRSTGFAEYKRKDSDIPKHCQDLLTESRGYYYELSRHAIEVPHAEVS